MRNTLLALSATAVLVASQTALAASPQTAQEKYDALVKAGVFQGLSDDRAQLDQNMTREQAAKIVAMVLGREQEQAPSIYKDIKDAEWTAGFIGAATEAGILEGRGDANFDPTTGVTLDQLAKVIVAALGKDSATGSDQALAAVATLIKANPEKAAELVAAAIKANPELAEQIVALAVQAAPQKAGEITSAALAAAPQKSAEITRAATAAAPDQQDAIQAAADALAPKASATTISSNNSSTIPGSNSSGGGGNGDDVASPSTVIQ